MIRLPTIGRRAAEALILVIATTLSALAQMDDAEIGAILEERIAAGFGTTMVVGIVDKGERHFVARGDGADAHTRFEIASITKVLTASLGAVMAAAGEFSWKDPAISLWRGPTPPRLPEKNGRPVTLADLATHMAGLPKMPDNLIATDPRYPEQGYDIDRLTTFLAGYQPPPAPFAYRYSNLGYALLGKALTQVGGAPFSYLLRRRLLTPLAMRETDLGEIAGVAPPFPGHDENLVPVHPFFHGIFDPAGGVTSTADDLLTFADAYLGRGDLVITAALATAADFVARDPASGRPVGLGWDIVILDDRIILTKDGSSPGNSAFLAIDRTNDRAVVVLANGQGALDDIAMHLLGSGKPVRKFAPPVTVDAATLDRYAGTYEGQGIDVVTITRTRDRLYMQFGDMPPLPLFPESATRFAVHLFDGAITFMPSPNGEVLHAVAEGEGEKVGLVRRN